MTRARVAVVGAGIVGAALADALVRGGAAVTVLDAAEPGADTSGWSLAWLNANEKLPRHYHDLSARAVDAWRELARDLGEPSWHVPTGSLAWAETDAEREALDRRLDRLRAWDYPAEEITARRAADLEPALRVPGGARVALFPGEAFVHGRPAVRALLARATAGGARLVAAAGEVTFEVRGPHIVAARLADGGRVHADVFVGCAGRRTPELFAPLGARIPLVDPDEPGSAAPCLVVRTSGAAPIRRVVNTPGLSLRPLLRRGMQLEAGDVGDPERLRARAERVIAGFDPGEIEHHVCVRPLPVDGHPIVGWLPGLANAYVSVTHSGMTLAVLLARLAAADIIGGGSGYALGPYRPDRFTREA